MQEALGRYPDRRSAVLPVLELAQRERGWLSAESLREAAEVLDLPVTDVASVASFYTMLFTCAVGKHVIQVCHTLSCELRGSEEVIAHLKRRLCIQAGETTADGQFTLVEVECLGMCGDAPVMRVDDEPYAGLTPERVDQILAEYSNGA